jgi:hypothetical protein
LTEAAPCRAPSTGERPTIFTKGLEHEYRGDRCVSAGIAADRAMGMDRLAISQRNVRLGERLVVRLGERLVMDQLGRIGKMELRGYDTK